ncbi:hypothetical protein [Micromonospora thermarum]|uniref:hypothetical protein n=1 Tax=Micromonospora thermarum TaxID=2720024 RepID=UPI00197C5AF4|nr:hypothetical protein [Micromonospora thermarum]
MDLLDVGVSGALGHPDIQEVEWIAAGRVAQRPRQQADGHQCGGERLPAGARQQEEQPRTGERAEATDWPTIARTYDRLVGLQQSPVIELNRAVAHGYAYGPDAGLALLAAVRAGGALDGYPLVLAVEADLTARRGDTERAVDLFREAAAAHSGAERRALLDRASELAG